MLVAEQMPALAPVDLVFGTAGRPNFLGFRCPITGHAFTRDVPEGMSPHLARATLAEDIAEGNPPPECEWWRFMHDYVSLHLCDVGEAAQCMVTDVLTLFGQIERPRRLREVNASDLWTFRVTLYSNGLDEAECHAISLIVSNALDWADGEGLRGERGQSHMVGGG